MRVSDTPSQRAHALLAKMNQDEKLLMVHGSGGKYVGDVPANTRLQIPPINLEDGPQGVADHVTKVTAFPSALTVVSTFNVDKMRSYAEALATEQRIKGTTVMLGPMVNIARVPMGGRNFESFGEDPALSSKMVIQSIQGIQSKNVIACVKHYVDNNQENNRHGVSENVDERTQWEIYYPAFQAAVDAGVGSFMCSYNKINNTYACENHQTLNVDLKGRMGFTGWVMSDWGATHSTVQAANNGLDQEMPRDNYFGTALANAIKNGSVPQSRLDDMILRILTPMFAIGIFDNPSNGTITADAQSPERAALSRQLAAAATVLLKNEKSLLPAGIKNAKTIAVLGDDGRDAPTATGGGSGHVIPPYIITPFDGIQKRAGSGVSVTYANTSSLAQAVALAKAADVAVVFVATDSHEGADRPNLGLGTDQDKLVESVAEVQPNTVVVMHVPGATLTPWESKVASILCAWMPGQEDGNAIADVLFGDVNPSAKLPLTFPVTEDQIPVNTPQQYPGVNGEADYTEKLLVGYRWYDAKKVKPAFGFGHGLSYTSWSYSNLHVSGSISTGLTVSVDVKNIGSVAGAVTPQLYIGYPESAGEPPKVMRDFDQVELSPGSTKTVQFRSLKAKDVSIWNMDTHGWEEIKGQFTIFVGDSSQDIRLTTTFTN